MEKDYFKKISFPERIFSRQKCRKCGMKPSYRLNKYFRSWWEWTFLCKNCFNDLK